METDLPIEFEDLTRVMNNVSKAPLCFNTWCYINLYQLFQTHSCRIQKKSVSQSRITRKIVRSSNVSIWRSPEKIIHSIVLQLSTVILHLHYHQIFGRKLSVTSAMMRSRSSSTWLGLTLLEVSCLQILSLISSSGGWCHIYWWLCVLAVQDEPFDWEPFRVWYSCFRRTQG